MKAEITDRIKNIRNGEVPKGYELSICGIIPEEWSIKKFEAITDILRCGIASTPQYVDVGVPFLSSQNVKENKIILEKYNYISEEYHKKLKKNNQIIMGDILYTRVGANFGLAAIVDIEMEFSIYVSLTHIRMKQGYNNKFYSYLLNSDYYKNLAQKSVFQGGGVPNLNVKIVEKFNMIIPDEKEQKKISKILSTWDKAIELKELLIEEKKQQKIGLIKKLLTGEVRLPGFDGKWKEVRLKDVFERVTRRNNEGNTNVLTISAQRGLINQEDYFNKSVASAVLDNYFLLKKGEFAYNKSYSNGYPMGAIKRLNIFESGVVTTLYICFRLIEKSLDNASFYENYFESGLLIEPLRQIAHEGGRAHGLLNVTPKDFFELKIMRPPYEEQCKVAEILTNANKEVELLEKELEAIKLQKKGLMQLLLTGIVRVQC